MQGQPQSPGTVEIQGCIGTEGSNRWGDWYQHHLTCLGPGPGSQPPGNLSTFCTVSLGTSEVAGAGALCRCAQSGRISGIFTQERERERCNKKKATGAHISPVLPPLSCQFPPLPSKRPTVFSPAETVEQQHVLHGVIEWSERHS